MALSADLPIYKSTYEYMRTAIKYHKNSPRYMNHSIVQILLTKISEVPTFILHANMFKEERERWLSEFICNFEYCKMVIRLAGDEQWISRKQQAHLIYLEEGIGKQVTAWKNSNRKHRKRLRLKSRESEDEE